MKKIFIFMLFIVISNKAFPQEGGLQLQNNTTNCTITVWMYAEEPTWFGACTLVSNPIVLAAYGTLGYHYTAYDYAAFQGTTGWATGGPVGYPPYVSDFIWTDAYFLYTCFCGVQDQYAWGSVGLPSSTCITSVETYTWSGTAGGCTTPNSAGCSIMTTSPSYMQASFN